MRRCHNPTDVDPENGSFFLPWRQMYLEAEVFTLLQRPGMDKCEVMIDDVLRKCWLFLISGCNEIKARFDFNNPILKCHDSLTPKKVLRENRQTSLLGLITLFSIVAKNINIQIIDEEWRKFYVIVFEPELTTLKLLNPEEFWIKLKSLEIDDEFPFQHLSGFVLTIMALPQANVSCEWISTKVVPIYPSTP